MIQWAKTLMNHKNFVVLDTETTGLDETGEICEIAIVDPEGNILMDQLVKPFSKIPSDVISIHGIDNDMVAHAPTLKDVYPKIIEATQGKLVVVYNASFDFRLITQSLAVAFELTNWTDLEKLDQLMVPIGRDWNCAMVRYAEYWKECTAGRSRGRWQKLGEACNQQGVEVKDAHRALGDCLLTLGLIKKLASYGS